MLMTEETAARKWRSWVRRDISAVRPLGGDAAKCCPVRTQLDVLRPGQRAGVSSSVRSQAHRNLDFEQGMLDSVTDLLGVTPIDDADRARAEAGTLAAMQRGEMVIIGGRLPTDLDGRRVGEPDILIRIGGRPVDGRWRYAPVDVKSHAMVREGKGLGVVVQATDALRVPSDDDELTPDGREDGAVRGDCLQLAHHHRMLDACGHASDGPAWGAILGSEKKAVWFRLDEPTWDTPSLDRDAPTRRRCILDVYDFEFGFRLDIAAAALEHADDPSVSLMVQPMDCAECPECPWRNHCWPQLDVAGDVSEVSGVTYQMSSALSEADLSIIEALAGRQHEPVSEVSDKKFDAP
jgi:hypothetical protein